MKILRFKELRDLTGLSRSTVWRLESQGRFPARISLSDCAVGWDRDEVLDWLESRRRGMGPAPQSRTAA